MQCNLNNDHFPAGRYASVHTDFGSVHIQEVVALGRIPPEDQEEAHQSLLEVVEGIDSPDLAEEDIVKEGKAVVNRQIEAYHLAVVVDHCSKVGKKGIGRAVVVRLHK